MGPWREIMGHEGGKGGWSITDAEHVLRGPARVEQRAFAARAERAFAVADFAHDLQRRRDARPADDHC